MMFDFMNLHAQAWKFTIFPYETVICVQMRVQHAEIEAQVAVNAQISCTISARVCVQKTCLESKLDRPMSRGCKLCTFRVRLNPPSSSNRWVEWVRPVPKHIGFSICNMLKILLASLVRAPKAATSPHVRPIREWKTQ